MVGWPTSTVSFRLQRPNCPSRLADIQINADLRLRRSAPEKYRIWNCPGMPFTSANIAVSRCAPATVRKGPACYVNVGRRQPAWPMSTSCQSLLLGGPLQPRRRQMVHVKRDRQRRSHCRGIVSVSVLVAVETGGGRRPCTRDAQLWTSYQFLAPLKTRLNTRVPLRPYPP